MCVWLGEGYNYGVRGGGDCLVVSVTRDDEMYLVWYRLEGSLLGGKKIISVKSQTGTTGVFLTNLTDQQPLQGGLSER